MVTCLVEDFNMARLVRQKTLGNREAVFDHTHNFGAKPTCYMLIHLKVATAIGIDVMRVPGIHDELVIRPAATLRYSGVAQRL
jgi:hypothetical protein